MRIKKSEVVVTCVLVRKIDNEVIEEFEEYRQLLLYKRNLAHSDKYDALWRVSEIGADGKLIKTVCGRTRGEAIKLLREKI
jgi:hypothetical protein